MTDRPTWLYTTELRWDPGYRRIVGVVATEHYGTTTAPRGDPGVKCTTGTLWRTDLRRTEGEVAAWVRSSTMWEHVDNPKTLTFRPSKTGGPPDVR